MNKISRRSYAKRRGVSETAIRKRIADGTLAKAMTADGKINPDLADKLLAENTTGGNQTTAGLSEARRRKAAASIALLRDEIEAFELGFVPRQAADDCARRVSLTIASRLLRIAFDIADQIAGKPPAVAATIIDRAVFDALTEISETKVASSGKATAKQKKGKALAAMTLVELATLRADLQSRRLEVERAVKRREVVEIRKWEAQVMHRVIVVKTNIAAMHAKLATRFEKTTAARARAILLEELQYIVEALACKAVSAAELLKSRRAA